MKPLNKVLQIFGVVTNLKNLKCLFKMILQTCHLMHITSINDMPNLNEMIKDYL